MMNKLRTLLRTLWGPAGIMLLISIALLVFTLYSTSATRSFNSDDVTWQKILLDWKPFSGEKVTLGSSNNFVDKIPIILLTNAVFPESRNAILALSVMFGVSTLILFFFSALYFMRRAKVKPTFFTLLPFVWFATFGYSFSELYLNPIWRFFEIGISFAIFTIVAMYLNKEIRLESILSKILFVFFTALVGVMSFSDPYFIYFTVGAVVIFTTVVYLLKRIDLPRLLTVYGGVALSFVFAKITSILTIKAGIVMADTYASAFIDFDKFGNNISAAFNSLLVVFGADFFGQKVASLVAISAVINTIILTLIIHGMWQRKKNISGEKKTSLDLGQLWPLFFAALAVLVFIAYVMSTLASIATFRYLVMLVFTSILFLAIYLGSVKKWRPIWAGLLVVATLLNLTLSATHAQGFLQPGSLNNRANEVNYDIIEAVQSRGLTKGYADFWQGLINTYLSNNQVEFLPTLCQSQGPVKFHWLIDEASFYQPADKSFFITDPDIAAQPVCTPEQLQAVYGPPVEVLHVTNKTIYIYDYDITSKVPNE